MKANGRWTIPLLAQLRNAKRDASGGRWRRFLNEASFLRLISALLCGISVEWLTVKICLNMNPTDRPKANSHLLQKKMRVRQLG